MLDVDATDDPLHGRQEGRFFNGYYRSCCCLNRCRQRFKQQDAGAIRGGIPQVPEGDQGRTGNASDWLAIRTNSADSTVTFRASDNEDQGERSRPRPSSGATCGFAAGKKQGEPFRQIRDSLVLNVRPDSRELLQASLS